MLPWTSIAVADAPDGTGLELRARGSEYLILADGHDLMSSGDEASSRALAVLALAELESRWGERARVLVGGLGMGFTLRAALDGVGPDVQVDVAELVPAVVDWNRGVLAHLAGSPLDDPRCVLHVGDVRERIRASQAAYAAILLDVDNGPDALAHPGNERLYDLAGLAQAHTALEPDGVLAVWSFSDDRRFSQRLERVGFTVQVRRVAASRRGRGRWHLVWLARRAK